MNRAFQDIPKEISVGREIKSYINTTNEMNEKINQSYINIKVLTLT